MDRGNAWMQCRKLGERFLDDPVDARAGTGGEDVGDHRQRVDHVAERTRLDQRDVERRAASRALRSVGQVVRRHAQTISLSAGRAGDAKRSMRSGATSTKAGSPLISCATMRPIAAACCTPCPEKPQALYQPGAPGIAPTTGWWSGVVS